MQKIIVLWLFLNADKATAFSSCSTSDDENNRKSIPPPPSQRVAVVWLSAWGWLQVPTLLILASAAYMEVRAQKAQCAEADNELLLWVQQDQLKYENFCCWLGAP